MKNMSKKSRIITPHLTGAKKIILSSLLIITLCFLNIILCSNHKSSALTYSSNVDVGFTFNPTISVNLSGDLLINNLAPGSVSDSNTINVTVATNASQGYVLTATSGTKTTNTDLVNQTNSTYKFTSIATNASLANLTTDNTWGFSYSSDSGSTWSNYSGLPLDNDDEGATGKQLLSTINPSDNRTIQFKIGAKAATDQAAGTYLNTINFYAVANPDPTLQPVSCPAGKICFNANSLTPVEGVMGQKTPSSYELNSDSVTLWAPNFKNDGYGFAGWNDSYTGNGTKYGPNQTITAPDDISTTGLSLYAMWIPSAGDMQNWNGCSSLGQGEVTALKDSRDNNVYAVAKLADNKCWMMENLRLADKDVNNNDIILSSSNTHNPSLPLTNTWWYSSANDSDTAPTSYHLSSPIDPTQTNWCTTNSSNCDDQSMLDINNTTLFTNNTSSSYRAYNNVYSYGNYYNWYSATAGHGKYGNSYESNFTAPGDICPAGWHLPTGISGGEFYNLNTVINSGSTSVSTGLRAYPANFVYSGYVNSTSITFRNTYGHYWSSAANNETHAYVLSFDDGDVYPGRPGRRIAYLNHSGLTVRCVAGT